jgi:hypothetical protein
MSQQSDPQDQLQPAASDSGPTTDAALGSAIESKLLTIAEELGTWLGTAERKTTDFLAQPAVKENLERIRDTAGRLLAHVEKGRERSR